MKSSTAMHAVCVHCSVRNAFKSIYPCATECIHVVHQNIIIILLGSQIIAGTTLAGPEFFQALAHRAAAWVPDVFRQVYI